MDPLQWFYDYVRYQYTPNVWKAKLVERFGHEEGARVHSLISSLGGRKKKVKKVVYEQGILPGMGPEENNGQSNNMF